MVSGLNFKNLGDWSGFEKLGNFKGFEGMVAPWKSGYMYILYAIFVIYPHRNLVVSSFDSGDTNDMTQYWIRWTLDLKHVPTFNFKCGVTQELRKSRFCSFIQKWSNWLCFHNKTSQKIKSIDKWAPRISCYKKKCVKNLTLEFEKHKWNILYGTKHSHTHFERASCFMLFLYCEKPDKQRNHLLKTWVTGRLVIGGGAMLGLPGPPVGCMNPDDISTAGSFSGKANGCQKTQWVWRNEQKFAKKLNNQ